MLQVQVRATQPLRQLAVAKEAAGAAAAVVVVVSTTTYLFFDLQPQTDADAVAKTNYILRNGGEMSKNILSYGKF